MMISPCSCLACPLKPIKGETLLIAVPLALFGTRVDHCQHHNIELEEHWQITQMKNPKKPGSLSISLRWKKERERSG
jgi:hypothetical protein